MSCNKCKKKIKPMINLAKASLKQTNVTKWLIEGGSSLIDCLRHKEIYSPEAIMENREICSNCEFSTKEDGKLFNYSQCMAPDPETNAPCACFIMCKSRVDVCPLNKWNAIPLTIERE